MAIQDMFRFWFRFLLVKIYLFVERNNTNGDGGEKNMRRSIFPGTGHNIVQTVIR